MTALQCVAMQAIPLNAEHGPAVIPQGTIVTISNLQGHAYMLRLSWDGANRFALVRYQVENLLASEALRVVPKGDAA
jgi:hypothetical protein